MLNPLRMHLLAGLACLFIAGCGGEGDSSGPGPRDGAATEATVITAPPAQASDAAQGADLPPKLNTRLDCAP